MDSCNRWDNFTDAEIDHLFEAMDYSAMNRLETAGGEELRLEISYERDLRRSTAAIFKGDPVFDINMAIPEDEGWAIFDGDSGLRIEKDDDAGILRSDDDAYRLVLQRASYGSKLHLDALEVIKGHAPLEWANIVEFVRPGYRWAASVWSIDHLIGVVRGSSRGAA